METKKKNYPQSNKSNCTCGVSQTRKLIKIATEVEETAHFTFGGGGGDCLTQPVHYYLTP